MIKYIEFKDGRRVYLEPGGQQYKGTSITHAFEDVMATNVHFNFNDGESSQNDERFTFRGHPSIEELIKNATPAPQNCPLCNRNDNVITTRTDVVDGGFESENHCNMCKHSFGKRKWIVVTG